MASKKTKAVVQTETTPEVAIPEVVAAESVQTVKYRHIVFCWPGTAALMEKLWTKYLPDGDIVFREWTGLDTEALLAELIADETVADDFILCKPNCVPCCKLNGTDVNAVYVYVDKAGNKTYDHDLPMTFNKSALVEILSAGNYDSSEVLVKAYLDSLNCRPVEAGYSFGNIVTPVKRSNPCENIVIEALVRKKFLTCSEGGFRAIEKILEKHAE